VYDLEADEITIGRGNKSGIVIRDNEVSRDHCRLVRLTDAYQVTDLNSSNGTFVNGQRVLSPWLLQPGALIELGDSITLEYGVTEDHFAPEEGSPPALEPTAFYSLIMIKGPAVGYSYPLESKLVAIGRDLTNDIVIQDPEVSRYHVSLLYSQRGYELEDMGSTNGTFINGVPLKGKRCLEPDDVIRMGTVVQLQYLVRAEEDGEDDTPVSRPPDEEDEKGDALGDYFHVDPERKARSERSTGLMSGALKNHVIIVYAREDWEARVAPLLVRLQDTRLNAWVDQGLSPGSDDWRMAVEQALRECWLMVLVVSPEAFNSSDVKVMYRYFLNENKPIILLMQDANQTLPGELNRLRSILYTPENSERSFHKLVFEIMQLRQER
jgi:pSer/pThr/pTyr-binding forkhead associated (FHA) protein